MSAFQDLTGLRFGRLQVMYRVENVGKTTMWHCKCDCGNEKDVRAGSLKNGSTKSCGCLHKEKLSNIAKSMNTIHGLRKTRIYGIWIGMKKRCGKRKHYETISVCDSWKEFIPFYEWAISHGYRDDLTIDRIDGSGDYCPENCRWATYKTQANNKSNNVIVEIGGEKKTLSEWSDISGIPLETLRDRLSDGWEPEILLIHTDGHTPKWKITGGESPLCKEIDMEKLMEMKKSGMKAKEICEHFGISQATFYERIKKYKSGLDTRKREIS